MRPLRIACAALASLLLTAPAPAQTPTRSAPVPREFDWHAAQPIPTATPWGQAVDVESTRLIRAWTTMPE